MFAPSSPQGWRVPVWVLLTAIAVSGALLGWAWPNPKISDRWVASIQAGAGWTYTIAWSLSFWPQVILNFRRKDVTGLSFDYLALNLLGWVAYSTFNVVIYTVFECPPAKHEGVKAAFLGAGPRAADVLAVGTTDFCQFAVEYNDVVFAVHALIVTLVTAAQCIIYPRGKQRVHPAVLTGIAAAATAAGVYGAAIAGKQRLFEHGLLSVRAWLEPWLEWVLWLYFLSYIKMVVTLLKYIPQATYNWRRRSTQGWSILNILLDFMGGILSLGQQLLTCHVTGNWDPITANPVKLGLAVISIGFDVVFMTQHYILYPPHKRLLGPDGKRASAAAQRRVVYVLRALAERPERLPYQVAEDALLTLGDTGVDVADRKALSSYADLPLTLPPGALERLLAAGWATAEDESDLESSIDGSGAWLAAGIADGDVREPLLSHSRASRGSSSGAAGPGSFYLPDVEVFVGSAPGSSRVGSSGASSAAATPRALQQQQHQQQQH